MRIVIGSTQAQWRGGEEQARLLAEGARERGHDVAILGRSGASFIERLEELGFPGHRFRGRGRSPMALWSVRQVLRRLRPDVLHFNDPHFVTCGGIASTGLGIPCRVAARRTDFQISSPGRYRRFCDRVICVSTAVQQICHESGLESSSLVVVPDGVDPRRVRSGDRARGRASLELEPHQQLVLSVASLTPVKGHADLIDGFRTVAACFPHSVLALAGDGPLGPDLRQLVDAHDLNNHVRFLGFRDDIPDLIQACDVFAISSRMEGLCSSIIDAMFAERAIVTTTAGGIPDLVSVAGEPTAWCVPPGNSTELAGALTLALECESERRRRATRARERAELNFTAERMVARTLDVFQDVLAGRQNRAA